MVTQDYDAYDEIDHAVWRFVLLQTWSRLQHTAHPAYRDGLARTGIGVERIPRIAEMDARLAEFGWGAVAVDGFIPPRAFQEFQALGVMTIAAAIRTPEHLAYTPAPDIIHESAGHAPIVPDPTYRAYLQRFGEIGAGAFTTPRDRRAYRAIHRLSELKEDPATDAAEIAAAERALEAAAAGDGAGPSEATLLSRLHWWTVEYGLVGRLDDYRLYGAGLLSSLGESHFCHAPEVGKLRLDATCIDVDYDITRPQPQLFVAEDFAHLHAVLEEVAAGLAQRRGGALAIERALASGDVATLGLDGGTQVVGTLQQRAGPADAPAWLGWSRDARLARGDRFEPDERREGAAIGVALGALADGSTLAAWDGPDADGSLRLRWASGLEARAEAARALPASGGGSGGWRLRGPALRLGDTELWRPADGDLFLPAGAEVVSARAGPCDPAWWPAGDYPALRRPRRHVRSSGDAQRLDLYRQALELWERPESPKLVEAFAAITDALEARHPDEWLLPWNLLECLHKVGRGADLAERLEAHLLEIESRHPDDAPISTGLRYLAQQRAGA